MGRLVADLLDQVEARELVRHQWDREGQAFMRKARAQSTIEYSGASSMRRTIALGSE